jgi:hypothetical protein
VYGGGWAAALDAFRFHGIDEQTTVNPIGRRNKN